MKINFYLINRKGATKPVQLRASYHGRKLVYNTGLKCAKEDWVHEIGEGKDKIKVMRMRTSRKHAKDLNDELDRLESKLRTAYEAMDHIPDPEELKIILSRKVVSPENVTSHIEIMQKEKYSENINQLKQSLLKFEAKHYVVRIDRLTTAFFQKFITFLATECPQENKGKARPGLLNSTINLRISNLKTVCKNLVRHNKLRCNDFMDLKKLPAASKKDILTEKDLKYFIAFDFGALDLKKSVIIKCEFYRDVYVFGFYTGLRYSDLRRMKPDWSTIINNEGEAIPCLYFFMKKGEKPHYAPMNEISIAIFKKYHGSFKLPSNNYGNEMLKDTFRLAGFTSQKIMHRNVKEGVIEESFPRWKVLSWHTSRAGFVTHLWENDVSPRKIQKMAGHENMATTILYDHSDVKRALLDTLKVTNNG